MFTLDQISAFVAVYQHGSYSAAGRALKRDRSTVREHIHSLEEKLNQSLFIVAGRRIKPTPSATTLYPKALYLNRQAGQLAQSVLSACVQENTEANIYYDISLPMGLMVAIEQKASETFPHLQVNWLHRNAEESINALKQQKAQLVIATDHSVLRIPASIQGKALGNVCLSAYTGVNTGMARLDTVDLQHLRNERQYICENHVQPGLQIMVLSDNIRIASNLDALVELIRYRGWAFLPDNYAARFVRKGLIQQVSIAETNPVSIGLNLYYDENPPRSPVIRQLIQWTDKMTRQHLNS